jgi:hypothetical protein
MAIQFPLGSAMLVYGGGVELNNLKKARRLAASLGSSARVSGMRLKHLLRLPYGSARGILPSDSEKGSPHGTASFVSTGRSYGAHRVAAV